MQTWAAVTIAISAAIAMAVLLTLLTGAGCSRTMLIRTRGPDGKSNAVIMPKGARITMPNGDCYELADDGVLTTLERSGAR